MRPQLWSQFGQAIFRQEIFRQEIFRQEMRPFVRLDGGWHE